MATSSASTAHNGSSPGALIVPRPQNGGLQEHSGYFTTGARLPKEARGKRKIALSRTNQSKTRVLVAGPERLNGIIAELFDGRPEFEVITCAPGVRGLARKAKGLLPDVIVASIKPIGTGVCRTVESIRKSSPRSRLVVICPVRDFMNDALKSGADAYVEQERIVAGLLPAVLATWRR